MASASSKTVEREKLSELIPAPEFLELETGIADDGRIELKDQDGNFQLFTWAYRLQDSWDLQTHRGFWDAVLETWPRHGRPPAVEQRARAIRLAMTRHGLSMKEAAAKLGIDFETFRRERTGGQKKVTLLLDQMTPEDPPGFLGQCMTSYCLPRIWAPDRDPRPEPSAYLNLSASVIETSIRSGAETQLLWKALDAIGVQD